MKRNLFSICLAASLAFVGCQKSNVEPEPEPPVLKEPEAQVALVGAEVSTAEVKLTTAKLEEYAYLVYSEDETPSKEPAVIFVSGTTGTLSDGDNTVIIRGLEANTGYVAVFALKGEEDYYKDILEVKFSTTDYVDAYTLIGTYPDGLKIHFKVPQHVKDAGNAIRYAVGSLPFWMSHKRGWMAAPDADLLLTNGQKHILKDTTFVWNNANIYDVDENGEPILDELGEANLLHTPFVPGEPVIFHAGEYAWDESDMLGWGSGYYSALFDWDGYYASLDGGGMGPLSADVTDDITADEDPFWTGFYLRRTVILDPPAEFDAEVKIEAQMSAVDGHITITPDDKVLQYCYFIVPEGDYELYTDMYLGGDESLWQWFLTSYFGMYYAGTMFGDGITEIDLAELFYEVSPESEYRLMLTAMGDDEGLTQKFFEYKFSTTAKTMSAPEVEVTAISNPDGEDSPYQVWYNVKCTSKNAASGMYASNYTREWEMMFNQGYTVAQVVEQGNPFSSADIEQINSDEGLDVMFSCMPNSSNSFGVILYNAENTPNENDAYVTSVSAKEDAKTPVESALFTELAGDWTMTGTFAEEAGYKSKVTISEGFTYPETLDQSVYDTYANVVGMSKEEVDNLYAEFKQEVDEFNAWLKSQNRMLCLGFGFENNEWVKYFTLNTPFDLFCSDSYNGYDNESMIWDCGPKWYLDVLADGSVVAPVHSERFYPLSNVGYYQLYAVGYDKNSGYLPYAPDGGYLEFPVEVSSDKNTISVNGAVYEGYTFYMNALYFSFAGGNAAGALTEGPLVLTRGWEDEEDTAAVSARSAGKQQGEAVGSAFGYGHKSAGAAKRKTPMGNVRKVNTVKYHVVSLEEAQNRLKEAYGRK